MEKGKGGKRSESIEDETNTFEFEETKITFSIVAKFYL